jgi:phage-related holin
MTNTGWEAFYFHAFNVLTEAWQYRFVVGSGIAAICTVFHMEEALVWCMFGTLTTDMVLRVLSSLKRRKRKVDRIAIFRTGMKKGLARYMQYMIFIVMAWACQLSITTAIRHHVPLIDLMIAYLVLHDVSSISRSLRPLGVRVPGVLDRVISGSRRKIDRQVDEAVGEDGQK